MILVTSWPARASFFLGWRTLPVGQEQTTRGFILLQEPCQVNGTNPITLITPACLISGRNVDQEPVNQPPIRRSLMTTVLSEASLFGNVLFLAASRLRDCESTPAPCWLPPNCPREDVRLLKRSNRSSILESAVNSPGQRRMRLFFKEQGFSPIATLQLSKNLNCQWKESIHVAETPVNLIQLRTHGFGDPSRRGKIISKATCRPPACLGGKGGRIPLALRLENRSRSRPRPK
ncbi:uncharacterized protein BJX67DRAFT_89159 [Aspergillus lucknowensis]|uniref:Uncharacterized protein n=1 Tax=Aspergillus lucknowensis TaxID=176173 RepID=A0ABR4M5G9_9EURO